MKSPSPTSSSKMKAYKAGKDYYDRLMMAKKNASFEKYGSPAPTAVSYPSKKPLDKEQRMEQRPNSGKIFVKIGNTIVLDTDDSEADDDDYSELSELIATFSEKEEEYKNAKAQLLDYLHNGKRNITDEVVKTSVCSNLWLFILTFITFLFINSFFS